nr:hypothetical protein [Candidatus Levybacteria bacterium]
MAGKFGFAEPVFKVTRDLTKAGYIVKKRGADYLHHSYVGENGSNDNDLNRFSLVRRSESHGWGMTDYTKLEQEVFGLEWEISEGEDLLGSIAIYPIVGTRSHLGGVQFRAVDETFPRKTQFKQDTASLDNPEQSDQIAQGLREAVASWITKSQKPQEPQS